MGISNRNDADKDLRALRRTGGDIPSAPSGYRNRAGQTVAQPGNDRAPYVWSAPFSDPMQLLGPIGELEAKHVYPSVGDGQEWGTCFPAVDVSDYRVISILLFVSTNDPDLELQLLPLVQFDWAGTNVESGKESNVFETWSPIAFVNPDPTDIQQEHKVGLQDFSQSVVQRTMGPLQLKTLKPGLPAGGGKGVVQMAMDFEVGSHKQFTLSMIRASAAGEFETDGAFYYTRRM